MWGKVDVTKTPQWHKKCAKRGNQIYSSNVPKLAFLNNHSIYNYRLFTIHRLVNFIKSFPLMSWLGKFPNHSVLLAARDASHGLM